MSVSEAVSNITSIFSARIAAMEALLPTAGDKNVFFFKKAGVCIRLNNYDVKVCHVEDATQFAPSITEANLVETYGVIKNGLNERAGLMRFDSVLRIQILELRRMIESVQ